MYCIYLFVGRRRVCDQCHTDGLPRMAHLNEMRDALLPGINDRRCVIRGTRRTVLLRTGCRLLSMLRQKTSLVVEVVLKS